MECFAQYLDDIDDLVYAAALMWERIRRGIGVFLFIIGTAALQITGIVLALVKPSLAVAFASLLAVGLLLGSVVFDSRGSRFAL